MPSGFDPTAELQAHFRRERHAGDSHPPPEQLAAFHEQRLSPEEVEVIREHLAACPDCTTQFLSLAELLGSEDGEAEPGADVSRVDLDAAWRRQRERLFAGSTKVLYRQRAWSFRLSWGTAAALGLAAALSFVVVRQGLDLARLRQPQLNPPLVNLEPIASRRQGAPTVDELRFPGGIERGWVILTPEARLDDSFYDIHVVAQDGAVVHRFEGIPLSDKANFRLEIPQSLLRAGTYRFIVVTRERMHIVQEFELRVDPSPASSP